MAITKRFIEFKGIAPRASDLLRDDNYFSDARNVVVSRRFSIKKRRGFTSVATGSGGNGLANYNGNTALIGIDTGVKDLSTGAWVTKTNSGSNTLDTTNRASFTQDNQRLFIANGINNLMKYDGLSWYRAGCPDSNYGLFLGGTADVAAVAPVNYEVITQFVTRDIQGNLIEGKIAPLPTASSARNSFTQGTDTTQVTFHQIVPARFWASLSASAVKWAQNTLYSAITPSIVMAPDNQIYICITGHTSTNTGGGNEAADFQTDFDAGDWFAIFPDPCGFFNRFAKVNGNQTKVNTVTVTAGHGLVVGDYIFVRQGSSWRTQYGLLTLNGWDVPEFENWRRVTAAGATSITFDGDATDFLNNEILSGLIVRMYRRVALSTSAFDKFLEWGVDPTAVTQTIVAPTSNFLANQGQAVDPAQTRGVPPKGRYLEIFQNLLFITGDPSYPNNLYWSNTENLETFSPTNSQIIGDSTDGVITGIISNNDYLIIFKKNSIYMMSGTIFDGSYRVERILANTIGCRSHFTIKNVHGEVLFLDTNGVYKIRGGGQPDEISDNIKTLISDDTSGFDFDNAIAVVDDNRHHYKLFMPVVSGGLTTAASRIFMWDYDNEGWWIHDTIDYYGGVDIFNNLIYFTKKDASTTTMKEQSAFSDNGSAISAYVKTNWFTYGEPSVPKKFIDYKAYALEGSNYTLRVQSEKDWVESTYYTDFSLVFDANNRFRKNNAVSQHERAMRLTLSNSTLNEDLEITGVEIEFEGPFKESMKR